MQEDMRDGKDILLDGSRLESLMLEAGFVDVKAKKLKIKVGDWGPGCFSFRNGTYAG